MGDRRDTVEYQVALQVRLGSQRLAQKIVLPLGLGGQGKPPRVLDWVLYHLRQSRAVQRFLLLCPEADGETLRPYARRFGFELFAGPEQDVLQRFCLALEHYPARYCFRLTGDNPLVHGSLLDFMLREFQRVNGKNAKNHVDYYWIQGLPYGFAAELFRSSALARLAHPPYEGRLQAADQEHVTRFLYHHPEDFYVRFDRLDHLDNLVGCNGTINFERLRLTLDTPEDYRFLQNLFVQLQQQSLLPINLAHWDGGEESSDFFRELLLAVYQICAEQPMLKSQ